jgi:hypothetical protein
MAQTNEILGTKMRIAGFGCLGTVAPERLPRLLAQIVALVGMSTGGMAPHVWTYPLPDGRGGEGQTAIQPLVESFLALDTWPGLEHRGQRVPKIYVVLASCRPFNLDAVAGYLAKMIGPVVRQGFFEI